MLNLITQTLAPFWAQFKMPDKWLDNANTAVSLVVLFVFTLGVAKLSLVILPLLFNKIVRNTKTQWDDYLFESGFFTRLSRLAPAIFAYLVLPMFLPSDGGITSFTRRVILAYTAFIAVYIVAAFLDGLHSIYQKDAAEVAKRKPIKSYIQLVKVFLYIVGAVLVITTLINVSPVGILSGVGAMSAVLLLVFKDSIMGFVSSIQLSANDMVRIGDWIEMPAYNADGNVIDVTLQSVKVQNWDMTISTIPIYALVSDTFKNWRGMSESGGRRIKRALFIDMHSVRFLTNEEIERLSKLPLLSEYMRTKTTEIAEFNKVANIPENDYLSGKHLTNLGTFRAYIENYLISLPKVAKNMTHMVRQLPPNEKGLPLELYVFSADTAWINYENLQSDIFDHLLAVIDEFGLRVFQNLSGSDFLQHG
ncbi:MAG: mechanosensitive ion channel family protein [Treponema sp.]|jgi:miniconductance mechanosensitive channel|nr:mechanosensitive ion channel family protein [Treponema sp.]